MPRLAHLARFATGALAAAGLGAAVVPAVADAGPCGGRGVLSGAGALVCTYDTVGSDVFTVPAGVTEASFTVVGASGGHYFVGTDADHSSSITGRSGGAGGETTATLSLTPGSVLQIDVAGRGADGTAASRSGGMGNGPTGGAGALGGFGGSNGGVAGGPGDADGANGGSTVTPGGDGGNGSGGGGASDVRLAAGGCAALTCPLSAALLVAAGGGGGGGTGGQGNALGGAGGNGGGAAGSDGGMTIDGGNAGTFGLGATQSAGGAGGLEPERHAAGADPTDPRFGGDGAGGAQGTGGVGGAGNAPCPPELACSGGPNSTPGTSGGGAGGGGGGGLSGGGGGSGGGGTFGGGGGAGGGGGGGSSFAAATATNAVLTGGVNCDSTPTTACTPTINAGNGEVTITWADPGSFATTTTLVAVPASPVTNQTLTLTATVAPAAAGTVEFDNHHLPIPGCGAVAAVQGTATCSLPVTAAGSPYGLNAIFVPGAGTTAVTSTSPSSRVIVGLDPTSTALAASSVTPVAGDTVTYTATVAPADAGAVAPTGTVAFADGGTPIAGCASQPLTGATATCSVSYPDGASHAITATYQADANFAASTSAATTVTVAPPTPANTAAVPTPQTTPAPVTPPASMALPVVAGSPAVGVTLTCSQGSWTGSVPQSYAYAWLRDGAPIAAGAAYKVAPPDAGHTLACRVTATNAAASASAVSVAVRVPPTTGTASAGSAHVSGTTVNLTVSCAGAAGTTCAVTATLTVVETLRGSKVIAVSAAAKSRRRTVSLGTGKATVAAGRHASIKIKLNATGRRLLAARHTLRVKLGVAARSPFVHNQTVVFKRK